MAGREAQSPHAPVLEETCMGLLKSSIEFRRSAPPSSAWPVLKDMLSTDDLREARQQARTIAPHTCIRRIQRIQTMMQSCASAAKLRSGGSILHSGLRTMLSLGAPPPRIVIGGPPSRPERAPNALWAICSGQALHAAGRRTTPAGASPVVTMRHSAISSFLASATIRVLRVLPRASAVCARYP